MPCLCKLLIVLCAASMHGSVVPIPFYERLHFALVSGLVREGLVPPGAIVDVGANTGDASCFYARLDRNRTVIAMETSRRNVALIRRRVRGCADNVVIVHAGIGSRNYMLDPGANNITIGIRDQAVQGLTSMQARPSDAGLPICRLDSLFGLDSPSEVQRMHHGPTFARKELGFFHLDVEGAEEDGLLGSRALIARDQPLMIIEVVPEGSGGGMRLAMAVVQMLQEMKYLVLVIEEICGMNDGCRNLLCLPRSRLPALVSSNILDVAAATAALWPVRTMKDILRVSASLNVNQSMDFTYHGQITSRRRYRRAERLIPRPTGLSNVGESLDTFQDLVTAFYSGAALPQTSGVH